MDAYSGYNQILLYSADQDKTAFIIDNENFCYKVMPFGLKNAGATYQRLMDKIFSNQIGRNIEVYVDDMVEKTLHAANHINDLKEIFQHLRIYNMKLNSEKCAFQVQREKFLGFILTCRGIEANPDKCQAILNMRSPKTVKEVQQLTGRLAALARFLPCVAHRSRHFFKPLGKQERFEWTKECEEAFTELKTILSEPPILQTPELALKSQALVDFVAEITVDEPGPTANTWTLYVDEASNNKGSGAGILLEDEKETALEQSIQFTFHASNNQGEYEALIAGLRLAHTIGVTQLSVKYDSLHVLQQVTEMSSISQEEDWRTRFIRYLQTGDIPNGIQNERKFKRRASFYTLFGSELYKRGFTRPLLKCLNTADAKLAMDEVHEGVSGTHIGGRSLASKIFEPVTIGRRYNKIAYIRFNTVTIANVIFQSSTTQPNSCIHHR
ncbi:uncharacterized protein [Arachis hypogaea]|uniref:uncharacterized protein n=1 Tax=Arachis hypogaea TaxID=3818 RepID=UPI003B2165A9